MGAIDGRFVVMVVALTVVGATAAWPLVDDLDGGASGLVTGLTFSVVSLALGHHWIRWSARGTPGRFVNAVMGVLAARVVALLGLALTLAFATEVDLAVALLTVVAAHLALGPLEIVYLKRTDALE